MLAKKTLQTLAAVVICTVSTLFAQSAGEEGKIFTTEPDPLLFDPTVQDIYPLPPFQAASEIQTPELVDDSFLDNQEFSIMTDGTGPMAGTNQFKMYIPSYPSTAGSYCSYIYMDFGSDYHLRLWGKSSGKSFPPGYVFTWDLNDVSDWLDGVPQEAWDYITLRTISSDGLFIDRLIIKHSSQEILDWYVKDWLDSPNDSHLGLAAMILERKLQTYSHPTQAAVHYGLRELGKTDGDKYGTSSAWCSEFASWCLRRDGWSTPKGSISTKHMKNYFDNLNRLYTQSDLYNGKYTPAAGDYLSLNDGGHSAIFFDWVGGKPSKITSSSKFRTVEGNYGSAVRIGTRYASSIDHVGKAQ